MPWVIDKKHSNVGFTIRHIVTKVRGRFNEYEANIQLNEEDLIHSKFSGTIQVASIDTNEAERDKHLRSAEFFDVARYPTMTYESTRIQALGNNVFRVYGNLTIRDVTREIVVEGEFAGPPRKDPWGVLRTGLSASGTIDRHEFGLVWNVPLEAGGVLVGTTVTMQLDLELMWVDDQQP
ncbi:hypothetical protein D3C86_1245580 [compost metagenome]